MDANSLIDMNQPVIIIQIRDESTLELMTNIDDHEDIMDILEDVFETMANKATEADTEVNKLFKRLH